METNFNKNIFAQLIWMALSSDKSFRLIRLLFSKSFRSIKALCHLPNVRNTLLNSAELGRIVNSNVTLNTRAQIRSKVGTTCLCTGPLRNPVRRTFLNGKTLSSHAISKNREQIPESFQIFRLSDFKCSPERGWLLGRSWRQINHGFWN